MRNALRSAIPLFALLFAFPSLASISGTLMNADGQAIAGAKISVYAPETIEARRARLVSPAPQRKALATATADANGSFRVDVPKEQRFVDLRVDAAGYAPEVMWSAGEDDAGAIVLTKAAMKTGTITANGKPVPNALVYWVAVGGVDWTAVTDEKGHYSVPDPSKWAVRVVVMHPDYAMLSDTMIRDAARMSPDRALTAGVKLSGKVANDDGSPAAGAELFLDNFPVGKTADDGTFTIPHVRKEWQDLVARSGARIAHRPHADTALSLKVAKGATLTGTIVDAKTRQPVEGAVLSLIAGAFGMPGAGEMLHTAFTDAKGSYTIANIIPGTFTLIVTRPGYSVPRAEAVLVAGRTLQKPLYATQLGTISGTVVDEDKRPVAAARITTRAASREAMNFAMMMRMTGRGIYSGPDGRFVDREVPTESEMIVDAAKKGYPSAHTSPLRIAAGEKKSGITLTIPRGIAFSGRVLDKNNKPVSGAAVELSESTSEPGGPAMIRRVLRSALNQSNDDAVHSASDGTFTVRVKEGRYDVNVKAEGFAVKVLRAQTVAAGMKPVDVVLEPGVEITGRVSRGGVGVDNAMVATMSLTEGMQSTTTGADGTFRLADLSPGPTMLIINKQDAFIQEMRTVTAPAANVNIELPPGGRITGHVVDKATHQPVTQFQAGVSTSRGGGGMVIQTPPMLKSFNSDDGSFTLDNVKPGSTQVVVNAPGYTTGHAPSIEVEEGKTAPDVTVELETGVRLTGKVTATDGTPIAGASVTQDRSGGRMMTFAGPASTTVTDPNGDYTIEALEPGEKTFNYSRSGYVSESRTVNLTGKEVRSDVQLSSGLHVSGQVVTDSGAPVPDATVRASSASDSLFGREAHSDGNGGFTFEGLAPGHYTFSASKSGYANGISRDVDVTTGAPVRVTMKSGGTITGHVSGLTADELQQANVTASAAGSGNVSAPVDSGGNYRIDGAPTGTVRVSARVGGPMFAVGSTKTSEPKTVVLDPGGSATADIEFKSNTVITGRVTRAGVPMQSASVMFFPKAGRAQTSATTTADANGVYQISGLADGAYNVQVMDFDRLTPYATSYNVSGSGTFDIDIRVASVHGRVLDATTDQPLADAHVEIRGKDNSMMSARAAMTDTNGNFIIDSVSRGSYQISADKEGFGNTLRDLDVADTAPDVELKLAPSAGITLNVVDGRDGRMLAASPQVTDMQGHAVAGSGFRFTTTPEPIKLDVAPGQYRVTLMASGYAMKTLIVNAPSTQTVPLTPGGTLLIQSKSSAPLRARLIAADGTPYYRVGMGDGTFPLVAPPGVTTLQNVAAGTYQLEVLDSTDRVLTGTAVTINEGVQTTVSI